MISLIDITIHLNAYYYYWQIRRLDKNKKSIICLFNHFDRFQMRLTDFVLRQTQSKADLSMRNLHPIYLVSIVRFQTGSEFIENSFANIYNQIYLQYTQLSLPWHRISHHLTELNQTQQEAFIGKRDSKVAATIEVVKIPYSMIRLSK